MITFNDIKKINSPETRAEVLFKKQGTDSFKIKVDKYTIEYTCQGIKRLKYTLYLTGPRGYYAGAFDFDYNQCWIKLIGKLCMDAMSAEQAT